MPVGSSLSHVLAGIFLLELDLKFKNPFLRYNDDYLIFCKDKREPELILRDIIVPILNNLKLEINYKKIKSGKFHKDKLSFLGFEFYAGYFHIQEEKVNEFKNKIINITRLTKKKDKEIIIKLLNNKILGFGHYYKFASSKTEFKNLDSFIRMRLRRYLLKQKELIPKEGNLILTNKYLKDLNLKSLEEIKEKYDGKNVKKMGNNKKTCNHINYNKWKELDEIVLEYKINYLIEQNEKTLGLMLKTHKKNSRPRKKVEYTYE